MKEIEQNRETEREREGQREKMKEEPTEKRELVLSSLNGNINEKKRSFLLDFSQTSFKIALE